MSRTDKELSFLHDLYMTEAWTGRFNELFNTNVELPDKGKFLYVNAGNGDHVFSIRETADEDLEIFATIDNEHLLTIAADKAAAIKSDVDFSQTVFDDEIFDEVFADYMLADPREAGENIAEAVRVAKPGADVSIMMPAAGSFGEIFSILWELTLDEEISLPGPVEDLIKEIPTLSDIEELAMNSGLTDLKTFTATEVFEYDNGGEFIGSPLVAEFLLPRWLGEIEDNKKEQVLSKLAQLIDADSGDISFRFSVKAVLLKGTVIG